MIHITREIELSEIWMNFMEFNTTDPTIGFTRWLANHGAKHAGTLLYTHGVIFENDDDYMVYLLGRTFIF